jgi:hypothetical protein
MVPRGCFANTISTGASSAKAHGAKLENETMPTDTEILNWLALRLEKVGWTELELDIEAERDDCSDNFGDDFRRAVANAMKVNPN